MHCNPYISDCKGRCTNEDEILTKRSDLELLQPAPQVHCHTLESQLCYSYNFEMQMHTYHRHKQPGYIHCRTNAAPKDIQLMLSCTNCGHPIHANFQILSIRPTSLTLCRIYLHSESSPLPWGATDYFPSALYTLRGSTSSSQFQLGYY